MTGNNTDHSSTGNEPIVSLVNPVAAETKPSRDKKVTKDYDHTGSDGRAIRGKSAGEVSGECEQQEKPAALGPDTDKRSDEAGAERNGKKRSTGKFNRDDRNRTSGAGTPRKH